MQRNHNVFKSDLQEVKEIYYDIRIRENIRVICYFYHYKIDIASKFHRFNDHNLIGNYVFHTKLCLCF